MASPGPDVSILNFDELLQERIGFNQQTEFLADETFAAMYDKRGDAFMDQTMLMDHSALISKPVGAAPNVPTIIIEEQTQEVSIAKVHAAVEMSIPEPESVAASDLPKTANSATNFPRRPRASLLAASRALPQSNPPVSAEIPAPAALSAVEVTRVAASSSTSPQPEEIASAVPRPSKKARISVTRPKHILPKNHPSHPRNSVTAIPTKVSNARPSAPAWKTIKETAKSKQVVKLPVEEKSAAPSKTSTRTLPVSQSTKEVTHVEPMEPLAVVAVPELAADESTSFSLEMISTIPLNFDESLPEIGQPLDLRPGMLTTSTPARPNWSGQHKQPNLCSILGVSLQVPEIETIQEILEENEIVEEFVPVQKEAVKENSPPKKRARRSSILPAPIIAPMPATTQLAESAPSFQGPRRNSFSVPARETPTANKIELTKSIPAPLKRRASRAFETIVTIERISEPLVQGFAPVALSRPSLTNQARKSLLGSRRASRVFASSAPKIQPIPKIAAVAAASVPPPPAVVTVAATVKAKPKTATICLTLPKSFNFGARAEEREAERRKRKEEREAQSKQAVPPTKYSLEWTADRLAQHRLSASVPAAPQFAQIQPKILSKSVTENEVTIPSAATSSTTRILDNSTHEPESASASLTVPLTREALEASLRCTGPKPDLKRRVSIYLQGVIEESLQLEQDDIQVHQLTQPSAVQLAVQAPEANEHEEEAEEEEFDASFLMPGGFSPAKAKKILGRRTTQTIPTTAKQATTAKPFTFSTMSKAKRGLAQPNTETNAKTLTRTLENRPVKKIRANGASLPEGTPEFVQRAEKREGWEARQRAREEQVRKRKEFQRKQEIEAENSKLQALRKALIARPNPVDELVQSRRAAVQRIR